MKRYALVGLLFVVNVGFCQTTFPVNGVYEKDNPIYAFTGATIYQDHNNIIRNGVMLVQNGLVQDIGQNIKIPNNCSNYGFTLLVQQTTSNYWLVENTSSLYSFNILIQY